VTCFFSEGQPTVPLIHSAAGVGGYERAILPGMSMRWCVLDSDGGVLIVDIEDNPDALSQDDPLRTGTRIVESFAFSSS
jgi:hypothetical protein